MSNKIVKEGYNKVAKTYLVERDPFDNLAYLKKLTKLLPRNAKILDIGCGAGKPIDEYLIKQGYSVIGIDISEKQIELAKKNLPTGVYEVKDMSELKDNDYQVDAIVSFYAIFHTPKETHQELFEKFKTFLLVGGLVLVTMGAEEWESNESDNFHGAPMYWSQYGAEENKKLVRAAGFEIIFSEIDKTGGEEHQVILAKKI